MDTWALVAVERTRLCDALVALPAESWQAPSLCAGRTAQDTLAHIVSTAEITPAIFLGRLLRHGFRFDAMTDTDVRRLSALGAPALLERLRAAVPSHRHPPGPIATMLMETVVHGEDIAYPLGVTIDHSPDGLAATADFAKNAQPLVGCRRRIAGLRLVATDQEWSTGDGPEVRGPLVALLLAMSGRSAAQAALQGDGVAVLRDRP
jgi:uncharacterized protein (TIGR03083 family)